MCGIIGYTGKKNAKKIMIESLKKLEYRGYDSAGISFFENNRIRTIKTAGRVSELEKTADEKLNTETVCGIGHTRWATHGKPSEINAHPHGTENLMIVHNGIIENYDEIKNQLTDYTFISDTDTEVAAKLLDKEYKKTKDIISAICNTTRQLKGSFALGIIFRDCPDTVFATKKDSPVVIGEGKDENFIASDTSAFSDYTDRYARLEDGDVAKIEKDKITVFDSSGKKKNIKTEIIPSQKNSTGKNGYSHYMLKEIHEEPQAMKNTFLNITKNFLPDFTATIDDDSFFHNIENIHIVACGTALHAGLLGKYFIEKYASVPVRTETAGEFRYSEPVFSDNDLVIIVSQSGETADSLAALRLVNSKKLRTLSVVNTVGSTIAEESSKVIYTLAGQETAVASTKAFNVQTQVMLIIAIKIAIINNNMSTEKAQSILRDLLDCTENSICKMLTKPQQYKEAASLLSECRHAFFIGRGYDRYLATEASLKLKEITYIHSEAYAASELKHGTISLIEDGTPVIAIATDKKFFKKMRSNIEEVKSRGAKIISVCSEDAELIKEISDYTITIPAADNEGNIFTTATAVQLLAYYTALELGRDIDKPRNLAKSVTVE